MDLLVKFAGLLILVMMSNAALQTERGPIQATRENVRRKAIQQLREEDNGAAGIASEWRVVRKSREQRNFRDLNAEVSCNAEGIPEGGM